MKILCLCVVWCLVATLTLSQSSVDCTTIVNSVGINNGSNACVCLSGFAWNGTACVAPANGTTPTTTSSTTTTTVTTTSAPTFNCTGIANVLGANGTVGCLCQTGYYWNPPYCYLNCSFILNSVGVNSGITSCVCMTGFTWNGTGCNAILTTATTGTTIVPGTTTTSTTTTSTTTTNAPANTGIIGATGTFPTVINSINCLTILNSNGTNNGSNACFCAIGYQWSPTTLSCVLNVFVVNPITLVAINCSQIPNSTGNTTDPLICACANGFYWIGQACVRNCSAMQFSNGNNINNAQCFCLNGSYWEGNICKQNCSGMTYTAGNDPNTGACRCMYTFTRVSGQCTLDCNKPFYGKNQMKKGSKTECACKSDYTWDTHLFDCLPSKGVNKGLAIGLGVGIPVGLLLLALLIFCLFFRPKPIPVAQPVGVARTQQIISLPTTTVMNTQRQLYMPQTTVTRTSTVGAAYPGPITKASISTVRESGPVGYGGPPPSMLPSYSTMGPSPQRSAQVYADPMVGQMYNNIQSGGQGVANSYNAIEMSAQNAYNGAQTSAQNAYNNAQTGGYNAYNGIQNTARDAYNNLQTGARDTTRDAAASVGAPRNFSP